MGAESRGSSRMTHHLQHVDRVLGRTRRELRRNGATHRLSQRARNDEE